MVIPLSQEEKAIRKSAKYVIWRKTIYYRDGYFCKICGYKGRKIEAHHIYPFKLYPERRFDLGNGITLCFYCHRKLFGKELQFADQLLGLIDNGVNSVKLLPGSAGDNTEPSRVRNDAEGVTTRSLVFDIERFGKRRVRCGICKKVIYRWYFETQKTKVFLCGDKDCLRKFNAKYRSGKNNSNYKPKEKQRCLYCGKFTSTPSNKNRRKKYCNNTCQLKYEYKHGIKAKITPYLNGRWTKKYDSCQICGTTTQKHYGNGLCQDCYNKNYWAQHKDSNASTSALPVKG